MADTKRCQYCGEEIRAEAIRCRFCRSRLTSFESDRWHRSHPEGRLLGVCAAVARALALPLPAVRLAFIVLTLVHLFGPVLYLGLWLIIPDKPGAESMMEKLLRRLLDLAAQMSGRRPGSPGSGLWEPTSPE